MAMAAHCTCIDAGLRDALHCCMHRLVAHAGSRPAAAHMHPNSQRAALRARRSTQFACSTSAASSRRFTAAAAAEQEGSTLPEAQSVVGADGQPAAFPNSPGVYIIYDAEGELQYVGMSRKVAVSVATHRDDLPAEKVHAVAVVEVRDASREGLTAAWQKAVQDAVTATGKVPPGNVKGATDFTRRRSAAKPEIRLTPGKGLQDLTVPLETIIQKVVEDNRVVAFVKGTRTEPQCGFSHRVLTRLNECRAEYEVVNVLDEVHNPGLRDTIKTFSQWPTIPQLYVDGEFVGGADIVEEMATKGELHPLLAAKK